MASWEGSFYVLLALSLLPFIILSLLFIHVLASSATAFREHGLSILVETSWDPVSGRYGLIPALTGTLLATLVSLVVVIPVSLAVMLLTCSLLPSPVSRLTDRLIEVMGALPTVVYGLWGGFTLSWLLHGYIYLPLHEYLGFIPLFSCSPLSGQNILTAGIVLGVSMIPYASSLLIEGYRAISSRYVEAAYSLGLYPFEAYRLLIGLMKPLVVATVLLSLSRALGETTIVALTIGNAYLSSICLLNPGTTVSAWIVSQFESSFLYPGASPALYAGVLVVLVFSLISSYTGVSLMVRWQGVVRG